MRNSVPAIALVIAATVTSAHADDTFTNHDELGLDVAMLYSPKSGDEAAGGAMIHYASATSKVPTWLLFTLDFGLFVGNADRSIGTMMAGARIGDRSAGPFARFEFGWLVDMPFDSDGTDEFIYGKGVAASLGWKVDAWQFSAGAMKSALFGGPVWMFVVGRDIVYMDAVVTRTTP